MSKKVSTICWGVALIIIVVLIGMLCFGYYKKHTLNVSNPIVTMEIENYGTLKIELYPDQAPEAVKNFITLTNNGFYNGLKFHRVVKDFMIQGGDIKGDGTGSPTFANLYNNDDPSVEYKYSNGEKATSTDSYVIKGEFIANNVNNKTNLTEGTIAMARGDYTQYSSTLTSESYDSAGSQFFIMTNNNHTNLSGYYAGFGKVIEGMDVVKKIEEVECAAPKKETENSETEAEENPSAEKSTPVQDVIIKSVTVETFGIKYDKPTPIKPFNYMQWLYSSYGANYTE